MIYDVNNMCFRLNLYLYKKSLHNILWYTAKKYQINYLRITCIILLYQPMHHVIRNIIVCTINYFKMYTLISNYTLITIL